MFSFDKLSELLSSSKVLLMSYVGDGTVMFFLWLLEFFLFFLIFLSFPINMFMSLRISYDNYTLLTRIRLFLYWLSFFSFSMRMFSPTFILA